MVDVFFRGYGEWWVEVGPGSLSSRGNSEEQTIGNFKLTELDGLAYKHTGHVNGVEKLLPSLDTDSVFLRMVQEGEISMEEKDHCYFEILKREILYPPMSPFQTIREQFMNQSKGEWVDVPYDLKVVTLSKQIAIENNSISETAHNNLLKQIGSLALVLAEKNGRYRKKDSPNVNAIAESVIEIIDALPDANKYGLGSSNLRENISKGINLIIK